VMRQEQNAVILDRLEIRLIAFGQKKRKPLVSL
jgi:hypothetical protein